MPSEDVVSREIEGAVVIVPLRAGIGDADDELYTLNESGQAIWRKLDGRRALADVVAVLALEFEADPTELESHVLGFATAMVGRGILSAKA